MSMTCGTCALQFPCGYVSMDAEEMEYLEGGGVYTVCNISAKRCRDIAAACKAGVSLAGAVSIFVPSATAKLVGLIVTCLAAVGLAYFTIAGNHNGISVKGLKVGSFHVGGVWAKIRW